MQELIEILILSSFRHIASIDIDHFLIVDTTFNAEVVFTVVFILEEILASGKLLDIVCHTFNEHLQFIEAFINSIDIAEVVGQCFCGSAIRLGKVLLEYLHGTSIGYTTCQCNAVTSCPSEVICNLAIDGLHDFRYTSHIRVCLQCGVPVHILPIAVITDKSWLILWNVCINNLTEL